MAFASANTAGNLIVAFVAWGNTSGVTLTDSRGNAYASAIGPTRWSSGRYSAQIFYARNIAGGTNTVTATFGTAIASFGIVYLHEYRGVDPVNPVDAAKAASGASTTLDSGPLTTSSPGALLFAAGVSDSTITTVTGGYTSRSRAFGNLTEDSNATTAGSYQAAASHNGSSWAMQLVAFRAAASAADSTAPTSPTGLTATSMSTSQINLSWNASTDNVGVAGYRVFRNGSQIATTSATSFASTGLAPNTTYSYAVTAYDAASNASVQSATVSATTWAASDTTAPTIPTNLSATAVSASRVDLAWTASTDNVGTVGYRIFRGGSQIATSSQPGYADAGLAPATTYTYTVAAYDGAGNVSGQSSPATATTPAAPPPPPGPAYPLKASANGRYLVDQNDLPFLMVGDSPQALIGDLSDADADFFFANRKAAGFNTMWINLLCNSGTGCNSDGTTFDGIRPFMTPGDLATPNEAYFARADRLIRMAASYGLLVILDPIETIGWLGTLRTNGESKSYDYGRYVGARYRTFPNIIWMVGNDLQSWRDDTDDRLVRAVARGLKDSDLNHIRTVELDYFVSASLDDPTWAPLIGLDAAYTYRPTYAKVLEEYSRSSYLPVFMVEASYEWEADFWGPKTLRRQEYWTLLSGATGQLYGNKYTWQFLPGWKGEINTTGSAEMAFVTRLFGSRPWYRLIPDQNHSVVTAGYGTYTSSGNVNASDYVTAARTADGSLVIAYAPTARTLTVDMAKLAGPVTARWYDPTRGTYVGIAGSPFTNSGSRQFSSPGANGTGDDDWVLVLETSAPLDTQAPSTPTNLAASGVTSSQLTLSWAGSTDNVAVSSYRIFRNGGLIASRSQTSFTDSGLTPSTTYSYSVAAVDSSDNVSANSQSLSVTTGSGPPPSPPPGGSAPRFVQVASAVPQSPQTVVRVAYGSTQTAGNTNVLAIGWNDTTASISSVNDSAGNSYRIAVPTARGSGLSQAIYYASNIVGAGAGANSVTVTFDRPAAYVDLRIVEYGGLDPTNPFDVGASTSGTSTTASTAAVTTLSASELIFGAGMTLGAFGGAGSGFTTRVITNPDADIVEDRTVATTGSYAASAPVSGAWLMQIATFRAAP